MHKPNNKTDEKICQFQLLLAAYSTEITLVQANQRL